MFSRHPAGGHERCARDTSRTAQRFDIAFASDRSKPRRRPLVLKHRLVSQASAKLIRGSGVDTTTFAPSEEPPGTITFVLAGRMLWNKGVGEFVEAARIVHERGVEARFVLVGDTDVENPAAIQRSQLSVGKKKESNGGGSALIWPTF